MNDGIADSDRRQLNEIRMAEAVALFQANQAGRTAIERVVGLFLSVGAIAGTTAAATSSPDAVLPLPAFLFLLLSYMFQQYADLTVIGQARLRLEVLVNKAFGERALIYETTVAGIRQRPPLVVGVRILQILFGLLGAAAFIGATIIAIRSHDSWIMIGYGVGTVLSMVSAGASYRDMLKASSVAKQQLEAEGLGDERALWISSSLFDQVEKAKESGEVPRQTAERLIKRALKA